VADLSVLTPWLESGDVVVLLGPASELGAALARRRDDLAGAALARVQAPTLLLAGGADAPVIALNEQALAQLRGVKQLAIVPGATHLFEEPGTLEEVARQARDWFLRYLAPDGAAPQPAIPPTVQHQGPAPA